MPTTIGPDCAFEGLNNSHWLSHQTPDNNNKNNNFSLTYPFGLRSTRISLSTNHMSAAARSASSRCVVDASFCVTHVHNIYSLARYEIINCFVPPRRARKWRDDGSMILGFDFISVRSFFLSLFFFRSLLWLIGSVDHFYTFPIYHVVHLSLLFPISISKWTE